MSSPIDVRRFLPWIRKCGERKLLLDDLDDLEDLLKKQGVLAPQDSVDTEIRDSLARIKRKITSLPR